MKIQSTGNWNLVLSGKAKAFPLNKITLGKAKAFGLPTFKCTSADLAYLAPTTSCTFFLNPNI